MGRKFKDAVKEKQSLVTKVKVFLSGLTGKEKAILILLVGITHIAAGILL